MAPRDVDELCASLGLKGESKPLKRQHAVYNTPRKREQNKKLLASAREPYLVCPPDPGNTSAPKPPSETKRSLAASLPKGRGSKSYKGGGENIVRTGCTCILFSLIARISDPDKLTQRMLYARKQGEFSAPVGVSKWTRLPKKEKRPHPVLHQLLSIAPNAPKITVTLYARWRIHLGTFSRSAFSLLLKHHPPSLSLFFAM